MILSRYFDHGTYTYETAGKGLEFDIVTMPRTNEPHSRWLVPQINYVINRWYDFKPQAECEHELMEALRIIRDM